MASIFSRIIKGEIPCYKIGENENNFAFLDISPVNKGHVLVVPKLEVDYIYDLPENALMDLHAYCREIAIAMKKAIPCNRIGITIIGLEVPHAHVHLIPINTMSDMDFTRDKLAVDKEEMLSIAASIRQYL
jgi:histidine triad (HIT) family protein